MKENVFVRFGKSVSKLWKKLCKFCKDTVGELKKVVWTPKAELKKSSIIVISTVIVVCLAIAVVDVCFSMGINGLAGLVG